MKTWKKIPKRTRWIIGGVLGGIAILGGTYVVLGFLKKQVPQACESENCPIVNSSSTTQTIHGTNKWLFATTPNNNGNIIAAWTADLNNIAQNYNFNSFRHGNGVSLSRKLSASEQALYTNTINSIFGSHHSFILFNQSNFKDVTTAQAHALIDIWVGQFGNNIDYYELVNEPWGNEELGYRNPADLAAYYARIEDAYYYLKSKTTAKVAIGFHHSRKEPFDRLHNLPDIIGYHWYPPACEGYQLYLDKLFTPYSIQTQINTMINNQNSGGMPPVTQTTDSYQSLVKVLNWLDGLGKPYVINEWGFLLANNVSPLENCQKCYCSNVLSTFNQHTNANFLGWNYYAFHETGEYSGILRSDGSQRPTASLFHK